MRYNQKLNELHRDLVKKENIVSDYLVYQAIKKTFNVPNLTPAEYAVLRVGILSYLKSRKHA